MFRIFNFICFVCFLFLFGEILVYFCKESINVCEESLKENIKRVSNKPLDNTDIYYENKKYKKIS